MMTNNRDIGAAGVLAGTMLIAIWLTDNSVLRTVITLPLLFITGHLATRAIRVALSPIEHALASAGMAVALCLVGGFVLYGISALNQTGWAVWELVVVAVLSVWIIRYDIPAGPGIAWPVIRPGHAMIFILAALIASAAYWIAIRDEANTHEFTYTEFWLVPTTHGKFSLGVKNSELQPETYDVSVTSHNTVVAELHSIRLNPGAVWTHEITSSYKTEATLYRGHDHVMYRRVSAVPD